MQNLILLHNIKNRARFKYYKKIDISYLQSHIEAIKNIKKVRINTIIKNIIIEYNGDLEEIKNKLINILDDYVIKDFTISNKNPNKIELVLSILALIFDFVIKNQRLKMFYSIMSCAPLLLSGIKNIKNGINSKSLEALAIAISIYLRDFRTANSTNFMIALGEYIEELTMYKSDDLIKELSKPKASKVWIEFCENDKIEQKLINSEDVKIGDIVIVGAGDMILIDGHIISGEGLINEISMTGETTPVKKTKGDKALSGTVLQEGQIKIWAENVGSNTIMSKIQNYMEESLIQKSSKELAASKMADKLVPITLGLGTMSYVFSKDLMRMASVLQADYSCALKLTTPVSFKSAISNAGKEGIIIKGAKSLEALNDAEIFVFDKTGTLTNGELEVLNVCSFSKEFSEDDVLNLAASIEEHYFHPVALAIVKAAQEKKFTHIYHDEVTFIVAHGVKSEINNKSVIIGSRHFLEDDEKISFLEHKEKIKTLQNSGETLLYIAYDDKLLGVILLKDTIRKNAKKALNRLRKNGAKEIIMLTGDTEQKASLMAKELGIDHYYAELLPTQKANILDQIMQNKNKVAFIGDGTNDAPALIKANVGISMCKGADITKASADIVLLKDDIEAVADAKELANACLNKIKYSFKTTLIINSFILILASLGKLTPVQTAFAHNGTTIVLLFNAMKKIKSKK